MAVFRMHVWLAMQWLSSLTDHFHSNIHRVLAAQEYTSIYLRTAR